MEPVDDKLALEIVDGALGLSKGELDAYLDSVCGENSLLRREVLDYLSYDLQPIVAGNGKGEGSLPEIPDAKVPETRYELGAEIGRGGMGIVLRAFDNNLRRHVAVKILKPEGENGADIVRRFLLEAYIGGQLQHPGIAPVYEIGRLPDGRPFIAMKLIQGVTLKDLLARRTGEKVVVAADQSKLLGIFGQVCQTIAFAHTRGVIHRDLKPANVMVGEFGEVQVMDWGIAKLIGDDPNSAEPCGEGVPGDDRGQDGGTTNTDSREVDTNGAIYQTRVGQVMGTPAYMSPEQTVGRAGRPNDVFSLGGILCEILTGTPPYEASSSTLQLDQATRGEVREAHERLRQCGAEHDLVQLAIECLDPDVANRPPDAGCLDQRIMEHFESAQERTRQAEIAAEKARGMAHEQRKIFRLRIVLIAVGFSLILGGFLFFLHQQNLYQRQQNRHAGEILDVEIRERAQAENVSYWSTMLAAFNEYGAGNNHEAYRILLRSPPQLRNWEWNYLHSSINSHIWEFEVPGRKIAFAVILKGGKKIALIDEWSRTQIVDFKSGKVVKELDPLEGIPLAVSADGYFALSVVGSSDSRSRDRSAMAEACVLWETTTGKLIRRFDTALLGLGVFRQYQFAVSPAGSYVACLSPDDVYSVVVYDTASGSPLRTFPVIGLGCTFGPDGHWFIYATGKPREGYATGKPREGYATGKPREGMHIWDLTEDRAARPLIGHGARILRCSPDRTRIARVDHDHLSILGIATGQAVAAQRAIARFPGESSLFSEDGTEFVAAYDDGPIHIWDSKTGDFLRAVGYNDGFIAALNRSSLHDNHLMVSSYNQSGSRIKLFDLNPDARKVLRAHTSYVYPVAVSSDGRRVFSGSWDKTVKVWDGETGKELFSFAGHDSPLADLDFDERSSQIVSVDHEAAICLWDSSTGELKKKRAFPPEPGDRITMGISFSPDGKSIVGTSYTHLFRLDSSTLETKRDLDLIGAFGTDSVSDIEFSPAGDHVGFILSAARRDYSDQHKSELKIVDSDTFEEVTSLVPGNSLTDFAYSPDGSMVALGFFDGSVGLWNLEDASEPIWLNQIHDKEVFALVFTPDGSRLFSGGRDSTIRIWDTTTGESFGPLVGHEDYVFSLDISDDGKRLVSGSGDNTVRIWDATLPRSRETDLP